MDSLPGSLRLTQLAHGGGCGCKLSPAVLRDLIGRQPIAAAFPQLLVGTETGDDAAVWQVDERTCVIATTDFFMPVVDDPRHFGRIAATNALSDIYAMGGRPIFALAILGMPLGKLPVEMAAEILAGGSDACAGAGIPVAGGHSIDSAEPIYGLAVVGIGRPDQVRRNSDAQAGDALILTKALGVGLYSAAIKKGSLDEAGYAEMLASTTQLNDLGEGLLGRPDVHAVTDVTGFGVLGHGLEMARPAGITLEIEAGRLPLFSRASELAQTGCVTGASHRNWESYGAEVDLPAGLPDWQRHILTDPQTSGGLLIACAPEAAAGLVSEIKAKGFGSAAIIGRTREGEGRIAVL